MLVHAERLPVRRTLPPALLIGGTLFAFILLGSLAAPIFTPFRFDAMDVMARMRPPDATHWLGSDEFGRDVLSRVLHGGSTSIGLGVAATAFAFAIGVPLGLLGGYIRGRWDDVIMRTVDILVSIPPIMLGLLILATTTPGVWKAALAVGIIYVPILVRLSRSVALSLAQEEFILAARTRGEGLPWILFREILPNALPPLVVETSLRVSFAILLGSVFSFLGLGTQPPSSDWGLMIAESRAYLEQAPWIALAPGIALCATIISINLIGEGLRQFLDVRSRPGE
jgi:peptide/nickel transport system permease protein